MASYCRCGPGTWSWAPVICKNQCPDFAPPTNVITCNKTVVSIDFTGAFDMRWFIAFPQTPDSLRDQGWVQYASSGYLQSNAGMNCNTVPVTILGIHPYNWDVIIPVGQPAQASVYVSPFSATVSVAVIWRLQGATTYFSVRFSFATGVTMSRVINGDSQVLGTWYNASVLSRYVPGRDWIFLRGVHDGGINVQAFLDGANILNGTDYSSVLNWGSVGLWSDGQARFSNLTLVSTCSGGGLQCNALAESQSCLYACRPGYFMVSATNGTISCPVGAAATQGGIYCFSKPPT